MTTITPGDSSTGVLGISWRTSALPWDPYLLWHDFAGSFDLINAHPGDEQKLVTVIVQIRQRAAFDKARARRRDPKANPTPWHSIPTHPAWAELASTAAEPFVSLMLDTPALADLLACANTGQDTGLHRLEMSSSRSFRRISVPGDEPKSPSDALRIAHDTFRFSGGCEPFHRLLCRPVAKRQVGASPAAGLPRKVAIGVIEDRPNYAAWPRGLIDSLWTQAEPRIRKGEPEPPGRHFAEARLGSPDGALPVTYGRYRSFADRPLAPGPGGRCADEHEEYRESRFMRRARLWSHGSAVLSVLLSREPAPRGLHLVQLPGATVGDTAGGSLGGYALDGILHAVEQARAKGCTHVVVNLSFGTHSGPHDQTGTFESAVKQLLDHYDGVAGQPELHVVVPVGNAHLQRVHSCTWLRGSQRRHRLQWRVLPDNPYPVFVELWLSERRAEVTVTLTSPDGVSKTVERGRVSQWTRQAEGVTELCAAQIFAEGVSQGGAGTMALMAIGPTQPWAYAREAARDSELRRRVHMRDLGRAPHGVWTIEVALKDDSRQEVHLDAWIQRTDAAPARSLDLDGFDGRQSYFVEEQRSDIQPEVTLSGVATLQHPRYHVVGAMRQSDLGLSSYSAAGPARMPSRRFSGPDAVMQVDLSVSTPGMLVGGILSSTRLRVGGSSMAAAAYTRALHDWLVALPPRSSDGLRWLAGAVTCPSVDTVTTPADPAPASSLLRGELERMPHPVEGLDQRFRRRCDPSQT